MLGEENMKNIKFIIYYSKPEFHKIVFIFISVAIYALGLLLAPLMIGFLLDNVINGLSITSAFAQTFSTLFGGVELFKENIWIGSLCVFVVYICVGIAVYKKGIYAGIVSETFAKNIRDKMYDHLQKLPFSYHKVKDSGDLIQRSTSDIEKVRRFLSTQIVEMMYSILTALVAIVILVGINAKLTLISFITVPILIASSYIFFSKSKKIFLECDIAEANLTTIIQENLNGVRVVKAFNKENDEIEKFSKANDNYRKKLYELMYALSIFWSTTDCISLLQTLGMIIAGIYMSFQNEITAGEFFIFLTYVSLVIWPLRQLGRIIADLGKLSVSITRIEEVLQEDNEDMLNGNTPDIKGEISFEHVYFQYEDGEHHALKDLNFKINPKETIAIMGPTGSGKSSLAALLTRLYEYEGSIKIDGVELSTISKTWLRKNIGIVLQEPYLFSKTIYDNISLAKRDANEKEVLSAAKVAHIHDVIEEFDEGYKTEVGERGVTLSGGQKQRIAIAQTLINESPIVIFDDSLSALDMKTDALIREELASISKDLTMIIITHRISSAQSADRVIVLEDGEIAQMGTHEQLIHQKGMYQDIYKIQREGGKL